MTRHTRATIDQRQAVDREGHRCVDLAALDVLLIHSQSIGRRTGVRRGQGVLDPRSLALVGHRDDVRTDIATTRSRRACRTPALQLARSPCTARYFIVRNVQCKTEQRQVQKSGTDSMIVTESMTEDQPRLLILRHLSDLGRLLRESHRRRRRCARSLLSTTFAARLTLAQQPV